MRGAVGSPITLTIRRADAPKPFDVKIVRAVITLGSVTGRAEGRIIYVRISSLDGNAYDALKSTIDKYSMRIGADNVQGIIVDLRNDQGGLLDQAVAIADAFITQGAIVTIRGRNANNVQRYDAHPGDLVNGKPIVVLINGGSASGSEIIAGALQDAHRATIVGTRSFGTGTVQTIIPLGVDGGLRLTTGRYYTPSGRSIQAEGIQPDVVVEQPSPPDAASQTTNAPPSEAALKSHLTQEGAPEMNGSPAYVPADPKDDKQLNYALDILRGS
jgi:carboxyl-terminal processing protease